MVYRGPRSEYRLFADRFGEALSVSGKSQIDVARSVGFSKSMVTNYLQAKSMPETDRLYKIAKYLNVDAAWLFGASVTMDGQPIKGMDDTPRACDEILRACKTLNNDGAKALVEYANYLLTKPEYCRDVLKKTTA